jgi:hypothetical protein
MVNVVIVVEGDMAAGCFEVYILSRSHKKSMITIIICRRWGRSFLPRASRKRGESAHI